MSEKKKLHRSRAKSIVDWVLTIFFSLIFLVAAAGLIDGLAEKGKHYGQRLSFGWGSFIIQTDSMVPVYPVKSAILTHLDSPESIRKDFEAGSTVDLTFMDVYSVPVTAYDTVNYYDQTANTGYPMTHRLREIHVDESKESGSGRYTFIVSGINLSEHQSAIGQYQAFTEKELLGRVKVGSTGLGRLYQFLTSVWGLLLLLVLPALYLLISTFIDVAKSMKEEEKEPAVEEGTKKAESGAASTLSPEDRERLKQEMIEEMMAKKKEGRK